VHLDVVSTVRLRDAQMIRRRSAHSVAGASVPVGTSKQELTALSVSYNLPLVATDRERDVWAALGDRTRRAIVLMLAAGPMSVGDLAAQLPVTRPAVSQHLKVLKDAGLVSEEAIGTRRIYRLDAAAMAMLREQLDDFWAQTLGGFRKVVERTKRGRK